jgi:8-oxo-dGTP pyrophosphatase MutT (NUDIX family)
LTARRSAKCIVVDADGRVLLFKGIAPRDPTVEPWWFCPGGGLEGDEGYPEAARRELFEETGIVAGELGEVILERDITITWDGAAFDQHEEYFLVRSHVHDVSSEQWTDEEREVIVEHRWWTVEDLAETAEPVFPPGIADLVRRVLERDPR